MGGGRVGGLEGSDGCIQGGGGRRILSHIHISHNIILVAVLQSLYVHIMTSTYTYYVYVKPATYNSELLHTCDYFN